MEFFATCSRGLEKVLGDELRTAGVHGVRPLNAGVSFSDGLSGAYRALLWSRVASRVLFTLARIKAADADELYEQVKGLPWEEHIVPSRTFAVDARGVNGQLRNSRFVALRVKDAICDRLVALRGARPDVDPLHPDVRVNVVVRREAATVSVDLTGQALDRRGYQAAGRAPVAPLRENLAAGMLLAAGWQQAAEAGALLENPLCGGGAIAIEAALIACDVAPGILRPEWGFEGWALHDEAAWAELLDEADERAQARAGHGPCVLASDWRADALDYARARARLAGVAHCIEFSHVGHLADATAGAGAKPRAIAACHVPQDGSVAAAQLPVLYPSLLAQAHRAGAARLALLGPDSGAFALLGLEPCADANVNNMGDEYALRVYDLASAEPAEPAFAEVRGAKVQVRDATAQQFASRLNKVAKQRRKWAAKHKISAYRVYDADLPDYNLAIDVYDGAGESAGRRLVHVAEYAAPKEIDPAKAARRLADALRIVPVVFEIGAENVFVKQRLRSKGGSQYASADAAPSRASAAGRLVTAEGGLLFEVDLASYLDTGLFIDHRPTRALLATLARGKRFLNLFAYTGSASVYAAAGGAKSTTTVDLSNTYLDWARRNFELNGLLGDDQRFERADVVRWVAEKRRTRERWDLIFCDPPTYSNSSKMGKRTWDVQRDHAELLIGASRLLASGGAIVFSCNLRSFSPDVEKLGRAGVQIADITPKTIPEDFERHKKVHHCYILRRADPASRA